MSSRRENQASQQQPSSTPDLKEIGNFRKEVRYKDEIINTQIADLERLQKILTCLVCTELISQPFTIQCGHVFCYTCINGWLWNKKTCPTCRVKVSSKPIYTYMIKEMVEILIARAELADPHGEGATLRKHQKKQDDDVTKDKQDLFPGIFAEIPSHRIRDDEDNVWRCSRCHYETEGRECGHCGLVFSDAFDEESFSNGDSEQAEDEDESEGSLAGFIEHDEYDHHTRHWFHIDAIDEDGTDYSSDIHADEMDPELLAFIDHRNTSEVEGGDHTFDEIREGLSETEGYGGPYDDSMMEELRREQFGHAYSDEDGQNQEPSHIFISSDQEDELDCDDPPQQGQPSLVSSTHTTPHIVPRTIRRRPVINTTDEEDGDEEQSESRGLSCNDLEVADSEASEINSDSGPLRGRGPNYFSSRDLREDDSNSEDVHATVQVINPRRRKRARTERPAAVTITIDSDEEY